MATVNMDYVQFYQAPSTAASFCGKLAVLPYNKSRLSTCPITSQPTAALRGATVQVLESRSHGVGSTGHDWTSQSIRHEHAAEGQAIAAQNYDLDDSLPTLEELLRPHIHKEVLRPEPQDPERAVQRAIQRAVQRSDKPPLEAIGIPIDQRHSSFNDGQGGSQDRPLIIEDDEAEAVSGDLQTSSADQDGRLRSTLPTQDTASDLSIPMTPPSPGGWYDLESDSFLEEALRSSLEQGGLTSTPHHSSRPSQTQINYQDHDGIARSAPEKLGSLLHNPLDEGGEGCCDPNWTSDLEEELQLALEELEASPSASAPGHPHSPRCSTAPSHDQINPEHGQHRVSRGRSEKLRGSSLNDQDECDRELQEQQEKEGEAMREDNDDDEDDNDGEWKQQGEKRPYQKENEDISNDISLLVASDHSHDTSDKDDEDDEEPRPAKRRKLPLVPTDIHWIGTQERGPEPCLEHLKSLPPPAATEVDVCAAQPQAEHGCLPSLINGVCCHTLRTSRSPSTATCNGDPDHEASDEDDEDPQPAKRRRLCPMPSNMAEMPACTPSPEASPERFADHPLPPGQGEMHVAQSPSSRACSPLLIGNGHCYTPPTSRGPSAAAEVMLTAEYKEWPVQGYLKRVMIGDKVLYNLEFSLEHLPDCLKLPISPESLGIDAPRAPSAESSHSCCSVTRSKIDPAALQPRKKRSPFTTAEDARLVKMKEKQGLSWDEIETAFTNRSRASLQVHYSTKLKCRPSVTEALSLRRQQRRSTCHKP